MFRENFVAFEAHVGTEVVAAQPTFALAAE
jgi:hypothetical protein